MFLSQSYDFRRINTQIVDYFYDGFSSFLRALNLQSSIVIARTTNTFGKMYPFVFHRKNQCRVELTWGSSNLLKVFPSILFIGSYLKAISNWIESAVIACLSTPGVLKPVCRARAAYCLVSLMAFLSMFIPALLPLSPYFPSCHLHRLHLIKHKGWISIGDLHLSV